MNLSVPNSVKRCLVGIWLSFLYVICVILVVFSLSTYLFQLKLNSLIKQGSSRDSPLVDHYCDASAIKKTKLGETPFIVVPCLPTRTVEKEAHFTSAEILVQYKKMYQLTREYDEIYPKWEDAKRSLAFVHQEIQKATDQKDTDRKNRLEIDKDVLLGNIQRYEVVIDRFKQESEGQLSSIFIEIDHFEKFFKHISWILGGVDYYWAFPQPILKIVLVFSMGILGSLIFVTIEFIKEPRGQFNQRFNMYFFRPFLGMIVALAMYVLVKSSLSSVVDGTNQDLSPYLISFLGIASGMLSEQAYKRIETTGGEMLAGKTTSKKENDEANKRA